MRALISPRALHAGNESPADEVWNSDFQPGPLDGFPGLGPNGPVGPGGPDHGIPASPSGEAQPNANALSAPAFAGWAPTGDNSDSNLGAPSGGFGASTINGNTSGTTTTSTATGTSGGAATISPFVINITWAASVASAPAGFTSGVIKAVQYLESQFVTPVTVNINVGWGDIAGVALGSGELGASKTMWQGFYTASQLDGYLTNTASSADDQTAYGHLPATAPAGTSGYWVTSADAKALGLKAGSSTANDGYVGFNSGYGYTFDDTNGVAAGTYDLVGAVEHEVTEVLGRSSGLGPAGSGSAPSPTDMFRYSAPGAPNFTYGSASYFSIDGGLTNLANFNLSGGDTGDWASGTPVSDAAGAYANAGVVNGMSTADLTLLDVIGYTRAGSVAAVPTATPTPTPTPTPTGISIAALATSLSNALAVASPLAAIHQVGGATGDTFTYKLGGAGAGAFSLATSSNVATLMSGAAGLAGSTSGTLYALTVTATDTTLGVSSPAVPVSVIVGSSGADSISVATLSANLGAATPTFVFGREGNDVLDGSSMTGNLWFIGNAGADKMTGGSGADTYIYASGNDSTSSAMDIITNFNVSMDRIDLTGLGTPLQYAGSITSNGKGPNSNVIAAHSVGWQTSGGNTFVYVNTSGAKESISSSNMQIELMGGVSLTSANILHQ